MRIYYYINRSTDVSGEYLIIKNIFLIYIYLVFVYNSMRKQTIYLRFIMSVRPAVADIIQTLQTNQVRIINTTRYGGPDERVVNFVLEQRAHLMAWRSEGGVLPPRLPEAIELYNEIVESLGQGEPIAAAVVVAAATHTVAAEVLFEDEGGEDALELERALALSRQLSTTAAPLHSNQVDMEELVRELATSLGGSQTSPSTSDEDLAAIRAVLNEDLDGAAVEEEVRAPIPATVADQNPVATFVQYIVEERTALEKERRALDLINKLGECLHDEYRGQLFHGVSGNYFARYVDIHPEALEETGVNWFRDHIADERQLLLYAFEEELEKVQLRMLQDEEMAVTTSPEHMSPTVPVDPFEANEVLYVNDRTTDVQIDQCIIAMQMKPVIEAEERLHLLGLLRQLGEENQFVDFGDILRRLWVLGGSPMGDPQWSENHLTDNLPNLQRAMRESINAKIEELLSGGQQDRLHVEIYERHGRPETDDNNWGENHRTDNLPILFGALEAVMQTQ